MSRREVRQQHGHCLARGADPREAPLPRMRHFCPHCPPGVPIVGRSHGMVKLLETIKLVAQSNCNPVLVVGETGTGKELAARAIHAWRGGGPEDFVAVNCAALTAGLLESELFGHIKGAFTGADRDKAGLFEAAGAGTLFLDEISEMPPALQAKLLRVLQDRTFRRVGGTKDIASEATIIASSNRDLLAEVQARRFRSDLYFRLAVFPIRLPPLRSEERRSDIPLLAEYFIETSDIRSHSGAAGLSRSAADTLMRHDWPGNVRELRNVIDRALILEKADLITPASLVIDRFAEPRGGEPGAEPSCRNEFSLEAAEREFIRRALRETGGRRAQAAALLGITRATLHAKLKRYHITIPSPAGAGARDGVYRTTKPAPARDRDVGA